MIIEWIDLLNKGEASLGGNTALVALVPAHLDVSRDTPGGSPGVLDKPVIVSIL